MVQGFAAHLILIGDRQFKDAIALVDESGILTEIRALDRETPFTRFYDGAIRIVHKEADYEEEDNWTVDRGELISIWQFYPYDLSEKKTIPNTRALQIF